MSGGRAALVAVSVLIPYRRDGAHREMLLEHVLSCWERLDVEVRVGVDDGAGPFSVSRAANRAARQASGDVLVLIGADHPPDADVIDGVPSRLGRRAWCPLYSATGTFGLRDTHEILDGADPDLFELVDVVPFCTAVMAVRASVWAELGGMDERFAGWGCEDTAFRHVLTVLYGDQEPPERTLRSLWHPPADRSNFEANQALLDEYLAADTPAAMRELLAARAA